ncbi:MAG: Rrf2 family transcriptional regulator [Myxococcales bacterium]|nr:Rrf2 family transcriptional regulator [Myxococcales bacterium]
MTLTLFSDYTLRTLLYLGMHPGRFVPVSEIAHAYGISAHHLAKAGKWLTREEVVEARRGNSGGLRLADGALGLTVGDLLRRTESWSLLECFTDQNTCGLAGHCGLESALRQAKAAFFAVLDRTTLADLLTNRSELVPLLQKPSNGASAQPS